MTTIRTPEDPQGRDAEEQPDQEKPSASFAHHLDDAIHELEARRRLLMADAEASASTEVAQQEPEKKGRHLLGRHRQRA